MNTLYKLSLVCVCIQTALSFIHIIGIGRCYVQVVGAEYYANFLTTLTVLPNYANFYTIEFPSAHTPDTPLGL